MADLHVDFLGKRLAGPVVAASGTFGFGPEYAGIEDLRVLGGISGKGLTLNGQPGNEGERLYETPSGLMNSIGLQNPGVQHFIDHELPAMRRCGTTVWANLGGHTIEENVEGVQMLCAAGVDFIELNISCPNVKQGGLAFGIRAADAGEVVSAVRKVCTVPLIVKLSPQAESIPEMCKAVEAAGADAISLCNTFQACAIDLEKRRPVNNTFAGLSGPAVRPIALRMVWQAVGAVSIPVVGLGGILTGKDALEFIMAGAAAVQVGTANFLDPKACTRITNEIGQWMDAHGVKTLDEIRGWAADSFPRGGSRPTIYVLLAFLYKICYYKLNNIQEEQIMAREALEVLKECEAFLEGHFLLSSGRHSGAYCQMAFLQQYPDKAAEVMAPVAEKLKELNIDVVVGPAMGGIVYAYELGRQMGKRAIFTERVDNVMTLKRFRINPGERCIIAEDVVTTGVSSLETKRVIEENGGICVGIACVVDRTRAEAPSPIPIVASALKLDLPNYAPEECPICKEGKLPLVHLGSRKMKEAAKQTL